MLTKSRIKQLASELGFDVCGVAPFELDPQHEEWFRRWIREGKHGEMHYLERFESRKLDFQKRFPDAKSVIVLAANYYSQNVGANRTSYIVNRKEHDQDHKKRKQPEYSVSCEPLSTKHDRRSVTGRIARYAWGKDYHQVLQERMGRLIARFREEAGAEARFESAVDTKPLLERSYAMRAGVGFIGKQSQLISPDFGPWLFLCEIVTNLVLEPDGPSKAACVNCRACIDACPTGAISEGGSIDARKCIAYLTIEFKGDVPSQLRTKVGDQLFGCDRCLEVCPYGNEAQETKWVEFRSESGIGEWLDLSGLSKVKDSKCGRRILKGTAMERVSWRKLVLNAICILENRGAGSAEELINDLKA